MVVNDKDISLSIVTYYVIKNLCRLVTSYENLKDKDPEVNALREKLALYNSAITDLHLKVTHTKFFYNYYDY